MHSRDDDMNGARIVAEAEQKPAYRAPRIDLELLTIVVHPSPYSKRTPLGRSRKSTIRRRWFS
jgi:hypothetical protein